MIAVTLPYPAKALWPNGRSHWATKARAFKSARDAAFYSIPLPRPQIGPEGRINWRVTVHPKTRHPVDDDNARASLKAYQDGFALAFAVNDNRFNAPALTFGEPVKGGLVRVEFPDIQTRGGE